MKILLVQTSFLGDTVLATPVIAAIKKKHADCELWMMTTPAARELVKSDPLLSGVIAFEKRGKHSGLLGLLSQAQALKKHSFDLVYSLHKSHRTALLLWLARIPWRIGFDDARLSFLYHKRVKRTLDRHEVLRSLSIMENGDMTEPYESELRLFTEAEQEEDCRLSRPYAVLVPGSVWATKRWHWQGYRTVAKELSQKGLEIVLLGAADELPISDLVAKDLNLKNLTGKTSLQQTMKIIKHAALMVCNDSLALHLASAFKVPTVTIFCATSPKFGFGPWQNQARIIEEEGLDCKPCRRHGGQICPTGTKACMQVSPARVIAAVHELLKDG